MDRDYPPNPALDALMIVVGELYGSGAIDDHNIANICDKLELSEHAELADRMRLLPFSVQLWADLSGGGNEGGG